jgi:hypothetical protein
MASLKIFFGENGLRSAPAAFSRQRKKKKLSLNNDKDGEEATIENDNTFKNIEEKIRNVKRTKLKKYKVFKNGTRPIEKFNLTTLSDDSLLLQTSENITENLLNFMTSVANKKNKVIDIGNLTGVTNLFRNISSFLQSRNADNTQ